MRTNHLTFLAAEFFILNLAFQIYDPIGISYILIGVVWIFSRKLAYLNAVTVFLVKGNYWIWFISIPTLQATFPSSLRGITDPIVGVLGVSMFFYGMTLGVKVIGKIIKGQMRRHAPDLLGMIN